MSFSIENRRYTGSKAKLRDWLFDIIKEECKGNIFADLFAGTGVIACSAAEHFKKVIINDFLYSNYIIYKAFFFKQKWNRQKILNKIKEYNNIKANSIKSNFFSANFGRKYFGFNDAKIIGSIREDIEEIKPNLNEKEYSILLASLIYSTDKISNTVGHYDAYIKKPPKDNRFYFDLIKPKKIGKIEIYREDANNLTKKIKADIVYIDPPYNSRQYSRFYHVLETLTKWEKPKLFGTALKPEPENMSKYCKVEAVKIFEDLIKSIKCKYIVVSYNNTYNSKSSSSKNKIELEDIKNILSSKGKLKIFSKDYRYFTCGKTSFNNHKEILFLTKVNAK